MPNGFDQFPPGARLNKLSPAANSHSLPSLSTMILDALFGVSSASPHLPLEWSRRMSFRFSPCGSRMASTSPLVATANDLAVLNMVPSGHPGIRPDVTLAMVAGLAASSSLR